MALVSDALSTLCPLERLTDSPHGGLLLFRNRVPYRSGSGGHRAQDGRVKEGTYQKCGDHRGSLAAFLASG